MKVPPKPPTYEKDKTQTRRTVKGAAGGMLGVDYEDDNRLKPHEEKATVGLGSNKEAVAATAAGQRQLRKTASEPEGPKSHMPKAEDEMVLDDEDAASRDQRLRQARRHFVPRPRLTIDKDAPERRQKRPWEYDEEEQDDTLPYSREPEEIDLESLAEAIAAAGDRNLDREQFFDDGEPAVPGDPLLTHPDLARTALGSPVAYAKHVMILGEAFRQTTGAYRAEVIDYIARMYVGMADRRFARLAIKEFGPGSGIIDIYPLEVIEYLVENHPTFLPKVGFGKLFRPARGERPKHFRLRAGARTVLSYAPELKIRGFAIKDGDAPGYRFEPGEKPGLYELTVYTPGRFRLLISGMTRIGYAVIDRMEIDVLATRAYPTRVEEPTADIVRDEEKIRRWPMPSPAPTTYQELLSFFDEVTPFPDTNPNLMSAPELIQRQHLDAARGPKGEQSDPALARLPATTPLEFDGLSADEERISHAETTLLRLAVATATEGRDVIGHDDAEEHGFDDHSEELEETPEPSGPDTDVPEEDTVVERAYSEDD